MRSDLTGPPTPIYLINTLPSWFLSTKALPTSVALFIAALEAATLLTA
jgi:hypothetical protein